MEFLQDFMDRPEVISIQMTLNIISEIPDIRFLISRQKGSTSDNDVNWLQLSVNLAAHLSSLMSSISTEAKPLCDYSMYSLAVSRVSHSRVSQRSTWSSRASSTSKWLETVTAYSWAHVKFLLLYSQDETRCGNPLEPLWTWQENQV